MRTAEELTELLKNAKPGGVTYLSEKEYRNLATSGDGMTIQDILNQRQKTHGNFPEQAMTAQALKGLLAGTPNWNDMEPYMREALELICTKLSRMCHGDLYHEDVFVDICGYSQLVLNALIKRRNGE